jgi:hypothetical protein
MSVYGIRWGNGRVTVIGKSRVYAEQLLREASGPFSRWEPAPRVVEVVADTPTDPDAAARSSAPVADSSHHG